MAFAVVFLLFLAAASAQHDHSHPSGEWWKGSARIIVADNSPNKTALIAVDLPSFQVSHTLSIPGTAQSLGLTKDNQYLGVFRARGGNDQHFLSFVSTGLKPLAGLAGPAPRAVPGHMRRMVTTKTVLVVNGSDEIAGVESDEYLVYHPVWKTHLMYSEEYGLVVAYDADASANPNSAFRIVSRATIPPGHFHLTPVLNYAAAPHTTGNLSLILDRAGKIVAKYDCVACHGSEAYEVSKTRAVALFGCNTTVQAVTIDTSARQPRFTLQTIPAADPRIGTFVAGAPGVFWTAGQQRLNILNPAQTPGNPFFYRTDVRTAPYTITRVNHPGSTLGYKGQVLRALGLPQHRRMLGLHRLGLLVMYDGVTGAALGTLKVFPQDIPLDATAPYMTLHNRDTLFVSVPHTGSLLEVKVNLATGSMRLGRTVRVGGMPGPLVVADQANLNK